MGGPKGGEPEGWGARRVGGPKFRVFFFPSPATKNAFFSSLSGGLLVELPKRAHLRVPAFINTTKIQREDTQRGKKRMKFPAGDGKKERNFGAVEGKGGPGKGSLGKGSPGKGSPGKGGPGKGGPGKGGPNQTLKPTPTHETPLHTHATQQQPHSTQHTTHNTHTQHTTHNKSKSVWPKLVLAKVGHTTKTLTHRTKNAHTSRMTRRARTQ